MQPVKTVICCFLVLGISFQLFSSTTAEYLKASEYLEQMGEVYFTFSIDSRCEIQELSEVMSIDNIQGSQVFAFANKKEFEKFLEHDRYYEVLTPPGLLGPKPVMSDYTDLDNLQIDEYPTFDGYKNLMYGFETKYPDKVKVTKIGESINGHDLIIAKVSDNVEEEECEPEWFMMGAIHGQETMGSIMALRLIDYLCTNYEKDARAQRILDSIEMYILPFSNPDGTYKGGNDNIFGAVRNNASGMDLNRNWPRVPGAGATQNPEKETQVIMAWEKTRHIVMNMDYHAGTETAIYPYSAVPRRTTDDDWWIYVCRVYADLAQENGPPGYYTKSDNGICNGYWDLGYVAQGTTKDWFYYFMHARGISNELTMTKLVPESDFDTYWNASLDATLAFIQECLNGIRGTVVDEVTKVGLPAKVFVNNYDNTEDSSFIYADSAGGHGNYYRQILGGTYSVTYSCPGCESKTVDNIRVTTGQATIVNVELDCGSTEAQYARRRDKAHVTIQSHRKGIVIDCREIRDMRSAAIYTVNGTLVKTLAWQPGKNSIFWNGATDHARKVSAGCYILQVLTPDTRFSVPFVF